MNKTEEMQRFIRAYREDSGEIEVSMEQVARYAVGKGWPLPEPITAIARLTKEFSRAARQETRTDKETGRPYRVNHVYPATQPGGAQLHLWIDIDEAPRGPMHKSLQLRREQMVGDAVQLTFDAEHWNRVNPDADPIVMELDFGPDVEWRKNAPDEDEGAA